MTDDLYNLERFVEAQREGYGTAIAELREGEKQSHWMWFIFPQIAGLGSSPAARRYALSGREEAISFAAHPVLGPRLIECTQAVLAIRGRTATEIFGSPDDLKFRSSMTLFEAATDEPLFGKALDFVSDGTRDQRTLDRL